VSTVADLLRLGRQRLGAEAGQLETEILVTHVIGRPRSWLYAHSEEKLAADAVALVHELLDRRARGEPVAYLVGEREFWSMSLSVSPETLIPRPETELLVESVLSLEAPAFGVRVVDLGTGSGAVALALARERPQWGIVAVDASPSALRVAAGNASRYGLANLSFVGADWSNAFRDSVFDIVVSNPPYVVATDACLVTGDLRYEPRAALDGGVDGLDELRSIIRSAPRILKVNSWLIVEHGAEQGGSVRELMKASGFVDAMTHRDLAGKERVSLARSSTD